MISSKLVIVFLLFFIVIEVFIYLKNGFFTNTSQENVVPTVSEQRYYWKEKIRQMGSQRAYDLFKLENQQNEQDVQHTYAHIFGELLYNAEKIEGIGICDATFAFGCYHSFFGQALSRNGDKIVKDLDIECIKKFGPLGTGCQHGIGHGLMENMGPGKLDEALEICSTIQTLTYLGCTSGVFMEYNFPTLIDDASAIVQTRKFDVNNPFHPCESIKSKYQQSCYFELGKWWQEVLDSDFAKMGMLCQTIRTDSKRESCFLGVGYALGHETNYDSSKSKIICQDMPSSEAQMLCLSGVAWSFYAEPGKKDEYQTICSDLSDDRRLVCLDKADLTKAKSSS